MIYRDLQNSDDLKLSSSPFSNYFVSSMTLMHILRILDFFRLLHQCSQTPEALALFGNLVSTVVHSQGENVYVDLVPSVKEPLSSYSIVKDLTLSVFRERKVYFSLSCHQLLPLSFLEFLFCLYSVVFTELNPSQNSLMSKKLKQISNLLTLTESTKCFSLYG